MRQHVGVADESGGVSKDVAARGMVPVVMAIDDVLDGNFETAGEFGQRFAQVASGVLGGLAEALRAPKDKKDAGNTGAS